MNEKKQKRQKFLGQLAGMVCSLLMGGIGGVLVAKLLAGRSLREQLWLLLIALVCLYAAMFLQIVIHEAGHLLGGLWSGYGFSSFRIGRFLWLKENGHLTSKRLSLPGTGGQCLMIPPKLADGKLPIFRYHLGGSGLNLLTALLFAGMSALCPPLPALFFQILAVVGLGFGLMNGIPMKLGTINNDGRNALDLAKSPEAVRSIWIQMKVVEQSSRGIRIKDMPEDWFCIPSETGMKNSMTADAAVLYENRLMDSHAFSEAAQLIDRLLTMGSGIVGLHRDMLCWDRLYCELVGSRDHQVVEKLGKDLQKTLKQMRTSPSAIRTQYTLALLWERDEKKADSLRRDFEKVAMVYPYPSDVESERELMDIAEKIR